MTEITKNKISLFTSKTQWGKSFKTIQAVQSKVGYTDVNREKIEGTDPKSIHFILHMNTIMAGDQFVGRLKERFKNKYSVVMLNSETPYTKDKQYKKNEQRFKTVHNDVFTYEVPLFNKRKQLEDHINDCFLHKNLSDIPNVVICCNHNARYIDIFSDSGLLAHFNKMKNFHPEYPIESAYVYIDEIHAYIENNIIYKDTKQRIPLREQIELCLSYDILKSITGYTATPNRVFVQGDEIWDNIPIVQIPFDEIESKDYVGVEEQRWKYEEPKIKEYEPFLNYVKGNKKKQMTDVENFIKFCLETFLDAILNKHPRPIVFVPAYDYTDSHDNVKKMIFEMVPNAVVAVLNGERKVLVWKDQDGLQTSHSISNPKSKREARKMEEDGVSYRFNNTGEVGENIYHALTERNLLDRPLFYTGYLCIGMGQTLVCKQLGRFTSAIISHLHLDNDELSQLFGRLTGRQNNSQWNQVFVETSIFAPEIVYKRCRAMQKLADITSSRSSMKFSDIVEVMKDEDGDVRSNLPSSKHNAVNSKEKPLSKYVGGMKIFPYKENDFEDAIDFLYSNLSRLCSDREKLKKEFSNQLNKSMKNLKKENGFFKNAIGGKSDIKTLQCLKTLEESVPEAPDKYIGNVKSGADNKGYNIGFNYGYLDLNNVQSLHLGVRWIALREKYENGGNVASSMEEIHVNHQPERKEELENQEQQSSSQQRVSRPKSKRKTASHEKRAILLSDLKMNEEEFKDYISTKELSLLELQNLCIKLNIAKSGTIKKLKENLLQEF